MEAKGDTTPVGKDAIRSITPQIKTPEPPEYTLLYKTLGFGHLGQRLLLKRKSL